MDISRFVIWRSVCGLIVAACLACLPGGALAGEILVFDGAGSLGAVAIVKGVGFLVAGEALVEIENAEPGEAPSGDGLAALVGFDGQIVWVRTYGGDGADSFVAVSPAADGGAFLAGMSDSFGQGGADAWVVRVGPRGEELWQCRLGGADEDFASGIEPLDDGGCLVAMRRSSDHGPEMRLVRLDNQGREVWSGPRELMPLGVPGHLHRLPPAAGADGKVRDGGFVLAGTSFVRQGGSQPFALYLTPDFHVADMRVPGAEGSAMYLAVAGADLLAAWTAPDASGKVRAHAARLSPDGISPFELVQDSSDTDAFGMARTQGGPLVIGLNLGGADGGAVRIQPLVDPNLPGAQRYASMLDVPGRRGRALVASGDTLALAGSSLEQGGQRPWLMLAPLGEFDGESLGAGLERPVDFVPEGQAAGASSSSVDETLNLERKRAGGGLVQAGSRSHPDFAWPRPFVRLLDASGRKTADVDIPHSNARVWAALELDNAPGNIAVGLGVGSVPGPASTRLLVLSPTGALLAEKICAEQDGRIDDLVQDGVGEIHARGALFGPDGETGFVCTLKP